MDRSGYVIPVGKDKGRVLKDFTNEQLREKHKQVLEYLINRPEMHLKEEYFRMAHNIGMEIAFRLNPQLQEQCKKEVFEQKKPMQVKDCFFNLNG